MLLLGLSSLLSLRALGLINVTVFLFSVLQPLCKNKVLVLEGVVPQ